MTPPFAPPNGTSTTAHFQAIQAAGSTDRAAIREALAQITEFTRVTGTMSFRGSGDPEKTAVVLQIQEGAFRYFGSASP